MLFKIYIIIFLITFALYLFILPKSQQHIEEAGTESLKNFSKTELTFLFLLSSLCWPFTLAFTIYSWVKNGIQK